MPPAETRQFNKLFADNLQRFIRFSASYVGDQAAAEDIVMDSFIYYLENRHSLRDESNLPAYILMVVKNKSLNYLRSQLIHHTATDHIRTQHERIIQLRIDMLEATIPEELLSGEVYRIVHVTLGKLPELTRKIFMKNRFQQLTYREIAQQLRLTEKSVEYHITKALHKLRIALKDYHP
jgi:RNA polymerase sigma-70 factor (ECF subfamily)